MADPGLLVLQDHDTEGDQLRHRRDHLPEKAAVAEIDAAATGILAKRREAAKEMDAATAEQSRLEAELAATEARIAEIDKRLYSGEVTAAKDLTAMTEEVDHLKQRKSGLEDAVLEAMEVAAPPTEVVAGLDAELDQLGGRRRAAAAALAEAEAAVDALIAEHDPKRPALAAALDPALLERYEKLRAKLGGVGAARLVGGSCGGCHLSLSAVEVERVRKLPAGEVATCEECGRILVP